MSLALLGSPVRPAPPPTVESIDTTARVPWIGVFVVALEVALFGPLLRGGTVWLLDSPSYLIGRHPHLPATAWSEAPWIVVRQPFEAALAWLYRTLPWGPVRLLPLVLVPILVTIGFRCLFDGDRIPTVAASLLYVVNPFVYERTVAGQEYFLLAIACLPLIAGLVVRGRFRSAGPVAGVLVGVATVVTPHLLFLAGLVLAATSVGGRLAGARDVSHRALVALGLGVALTASWAVPAVFTTNAQASSDLALEGFRTVADPRLGLLVNTLGLYGFWREGWPLAKDAIGAWPLFLVAIGSVCVIGASQVRSSVGTIAAAARRRAFVLALALAAPVALLLSFGDRGPTGWAFETAVRDLGPFQVMREPQKFLAVVVLAYATTFGLGVVAVAARSASRRRRAATIALLLAVPCVYSFRSFWGAAGYVEPSTAPASIERADAIIGATGGVLVLPWHRYLPLPWTDGRVVASPFASAFRAPTVVSDDPEMPSSEPVPTDARTRAIGSVLIDAPRRTDLGARLLRRGITHVVLSKVVDWRAYDWLHRQRDLVVVAEWRDLAVFRAVPAGPSTIA